MHELTRMTYLEAMGVDSYVSRRQLPGAAPTRRLAVQRSTSTPQAAEPVNDHNPPVGQPPVPMPRLEDAPSGAARATATRPTGPGEERHKVVDRFSLAAITAGGYLWVEELAQLALAREQVQLVHAMALALTGRDGAPQVQQFDWPLHNNRQLDLGEEAARAGVAGFLQRQFEQQGCQGLVVLGDGSRRRVALDMLGDIPVIHTLDTLTLLANPQLKKQAWRDLQPIVRVG